jgi:hypothetical protein
MPAEHGPHLGQQARRQPQHSRDTDRDISAALKESPRLSGALTVHMHVGALPVLS